VINSCIPLFYISAILLIAQVPTSAQDPADALYRNRATLASAQHAAQIWSARLASDRRDYDAGWKLARAQYWLGTNGLPQHERKAALEAGIAAARAAIAANSARPEGHFWLAANMGALAESFGLRQGLKYRGAIRDALETVLQLDPAFQQGSADRALGRWYYKVPGLFGGDKRKSEAHLRKALAHNPQSVITRFFLAETLLELNRRTEARQELELAIAAPDDPEWAPEDRVFRAQAKALLATLR
jgi:hypothetical protein